MILRLNPLKIGLNEFEDLSCLSFAKPVINPLNRLVIAFARIAGLAARKHVWGNSARTGAIRDWYPVIGGEFSKRQQTLLVPAVSTAIVPIIQAGTPIISSELKRFLVELIAPAMYLDTVFFGIIFAPISSMFSKSQSNPRIVSLIPFFASLAYFILVLFSILPSPLRSLCTIFLIVLPIGFFCLFFMRMIPIIRSAFGFFPMGSGISSCACSACFGVFCIVLLIEIGITSERPRILLFIFLWCHMLTIARIVTWLAIAMQPVFLFLASWKIFGGARKACFTFAAPFEVWNRGIIRGRHGVYSTVSHSPAVSQTARGFCVPVIIPQKGLS